MSTLLVKLVNTLPASKSGHTLYFSKTSIPDIVDLVVTDSTGTVARQNSTLTDAQNILTSKTSIVPLSNKIPLGNSSGQIDLGYSDLLGGVSVASLHRSPNAITALFVYDTTKDSDGGLWTDRCQHTSWYNEPLSGKWLGRVGSESAARAITGATTNDYYQLTTDGMFYKLNAGSGTTQVYRGNKANFPKFVGIVAENSQQALTLYDLTEPNCPMWMQFITTASTDAYLDFMRSGRVAISIYALNGMIGLCLANNGGFGIAGFLSDTLEKPGTSVAFGIRNRNTSNILKYNTLGYKGIISGFGASYCLSVKMTVLPNAPMEYGLPRPTIIISRGYSGSNGGVSIIHNNKNIVMTASTTQYDTIASDSKILLVGRVSDSSIYYALTPGNLANNFALITVTHSAPPYFNDSQTTQLKSLSAGRYMLHGSQNSVRHLLAHYATYARSLTMRTTSSEQTGWLVGDSRRCYCGDNAVSAMTTGTMIPPISRARLVQRLGGETQVRSLLSLGNGVVLAGTYASGQIYRSTDNGLTFTLVQRLGSETYVLSLLSLGNGIVLAGTAPSGQIYRSTDNGLSFNLIQRLGSDTYVFSLLSLGNGIVLAGTYPTGQVYRSTDNGLSFTLVQRLGSDTYVFSLLSLGNGIVLAGTGDTGQIYRSTDNGLTFTLVQRLGSDTYVFSLLSLGNGIVLAGTAPSGQIYRSTDNGLSFNLIQRLGNEIQVRSLLSLGNGVVLAGTNPTGQIYRSTDNGLSFTLVQPLGSETYVLSLLSLGNGVVLAGTAPTGQIYRSTFSYITGTLTKAPVATNTDLTAYSGFSNSNYAREAYSADLDFGTAEWTLSAWIKIPSAHSALTTICHRGYSSGAYLSLSVTAGSLLTATAYDGTTTRTVTGTNAYNIDAWIKVRVSYTTDGSLTLSINAVTEGTATGTPLLTLNNSDAELTIGNSYALDAPFDGSLCLLKLSATVPSADQMVFMYGQESQLFRDNAKCVLPDATNLVDLSYDDETDTWSALSATNRSDWNGLVRVSTNAVPAGTYSKIDSRSGLSLTGRDTVTPGVDYTRVRRSLRPQLGYVQTLATNITLDYIGGFTATTANTSTAITSISGYSIPAETTHYGAIVTGTNIPASTQLYAISGTTGYLSKPATGAGSVNISFTDFILPVGYTAYEVTVAGTLKQEGSTKDYTLLHDGFREIVRFNTAPGYTAWVCIQATLAN